MSYFFILIVVIIAGLLRDIFFLVINKKKLTVQYVARINSLKSIHPFLSLSKLVNISSVTVSPFV